MSLIDIFLFLINIGLLCWILQLKYRVRHLEKDNQSTPPDPETLTVQDLRNLQKSLTQLVGNVEDYTESQLAKMRLQTETLRTLCERMELKLKELEEPTMPVMEREGTTTRVVPLSSKQSPSKHKDRDRIMELYQRGWSLDKIAEELRVTRGEVQLIVNLT